jgi:hypothetical protein
VKRKESYPPGRKRTNESSGDWHGLASLKRHMLVLFDFKVTDARLEDERLQLSLA